MKVLIPNNLNVPELIEDLNPSNRRHKTVKEKIYHLVYRIGATHTNLNNFDKNGYTRICSKELNKILNRDYKLILDLLKTKRVIDLDINYLKGVRCNKIKLHPDYQKTNKIYKTIKRKSPVKTPVIQLLDFYFNDKIEINPAYKICIKHIYDTIHEGITNDNELQILKNKIGIWLLNINDIENNQYWYKKSTTNWRYNSNITNNPKIFKKYLKYNNESLVQVDVKCSQVYILSSILNYDFFKSNNQLSFYQIMNTLLNDKLINDIKSYMFSPLMFARCEKRKYLGKDEIIIKDHHEFQKFRDAPFQEDFYSHLFELEHGVSPTDSQRKSIKKDIMYVLFQSNRKHRELVEGVRLLKKFYPYVNQFILKIMDGIGKRNFSLLLQRVESYLILDCVVPEFYRRFPAAPIFTIHDCIITTEKYKLELTNVMFEVLYEITGIKPGLSVEKLDPSDPLDDDFIKEMSEEIHKKSTKRRFKKMIWSILDKHIETTNEFLRYTIKNK